MLCWFLLYSKVNQLYVHIYPFRSPQSPEFPALCSGFSCVALSVYGRLGLAPHSTEDHPPWPPLLPQLPDGSEIPLPPILLGKLGSDPQKKTVCIYGHLDVQPAALEDGWDSEPFTLVERDGRLLPGGRGPVPHWPWEVQPSLSVATFPEPAVFTEPRNRVLEASHLCSILETPGSLPFPTEPGLRGLGHTGLPAPAAAFPRSLA